MARGARAAALRRRAWNRGRQRLRRLRASAAPIAQTTAAAALAWWLAARLLPEPRPLFAPLAAIIALGATTGERGLRALQVALGVTVGVGAAAVVVELVGAGTAQLAIVTAVALSTAVLVSDAPTFVVQAGVSGALVVAVGGNGVVGYDRLLEALVGSAVALAFSQVLFPVDVVRAARGATAGVLEELGHALVDWADAAAAGDRDATEAIEHHVRDTAARAPGAGSALHAGQRTVRLSRLRLSTRDRLRRYAELHAHLDALADAAHAALLAAAPLVGDDGSPAPRPVCEAVATLGRAACRVAGAQRRPDGEAVALSEAGRREASALRRSAEDPATRLAADRIDALATALLRVAGAADPSGSQP